MNLNKAANIYLKFFILIIILSISLKTEALPEDKNKPIHLAADYADLNQQCHLGKYHGNIHFEQGSTHLQAATAITQGDEKNKIIFAIARGNKTLQAHYWAQSALDKPILHAYANIIRYYPERHLIELEGQAKIIQGKNFFAAEKIRYDTLQQQVILKNTGQNRTMMIIYPEKKHE